ncbi:uridine phosphorylase [Hoeflea alexandrii]|uniref:phosphorylase family protein n=1 Tax=Hoeflea alexandrii TaxID=288436 RepID=UPI0022AF2815|nr:uridine phosphorylase [Hoeflea alexandrii]MCZ4291493.1 uridine phosphorylase [Hoeflea alexandrii]
MKRAWYSGHSAEELGDSAILVGDPDRVERIGALLDEPVFLPVKRGLKTVTGTWNGKRVSIVAFGMGAPIATIVLHEFADLGITRFVRIGTAMYFPPSTGGEFLISESAIGFDGTSPAYGVPAGEMVAADPALVTALMQASAAAEETSHRGLYATYDAFYRDMFGIDAKGSARADEMRKEMNGRGVMALDMETSALLAAGQDLGVAVATMCYGTVDALSQEKLGAEALDRGEGQLFRIALNAITN